MSDTINDEKELEILETIRAAAEAPEKAGNKESGAQPFIFYSENITADKVSGENVCGLRDITFL